MRLFETVRKSKPSLVVVAHTEHPPRRPRTPETRRQAA